MSADALSAREIEVLRAVASGCSNKIVADRLHISEDTVNRTSYASNARCRRSFFWTNNSHQVRLPRWYIHLANAEA